MSDLSAENLAFLQKIGQVTDTSTAKASEPAAEKVEE